MRVCTNGQCRQQQFPRTDPAVLVLGRCGERGLLRGKASWPARLIEGWFDEDGAGALETALAR